MRNPEETRRRLLEAATAEFAAYGIAGARVDRIAETAGCNKQSIYGYFGSKEGLFDAVVDSIVVQVISTIPIDAHDLPGYAARLFDWYVTRPDVLRIASWMQLERGDLAWAGKNAAAARLDKVAKVREAQQAGVVTTAMSPEHVLALVGRLASVQLDQCSLSKAERTRLRAAMVEAVRRVTAP